MEVDLSEIILPGLVALITALTTSTVAHYLSTKKLEKQFYENYRVKYFDKQLTAYQLLWKEYAPLSRYYTDNTIFTLADKEIVLNIRNASTFCENISLFAFSEHGIFISKETRKQFFILRGVLNDLSTNYHYDKINQKEVRSKINSIVDELFRLTRNDLGLMNLTLNVDDKLKK